MEEKNNPINSGSFQNKDEYAKDNGKLKAQIHICPECGKRSELYSIYEIIQTALCIDCQLKKLGKRNSNRYIF